MSAPDEDRIDPAVVAELHARHADELRRFLTGVLRDAQLANDVMQTAFTRLVEQGHTARPESRKGWLFRVAYNEAMLVRRREAVADRLLPRAAWFAQPPEEPVDGLLRAETVQRVRRAITELSPQQQQIVRMRIYEDKTFATIAQELGIPLGTALGRMHAALEKLRSRLAE